MRQANSCRETVERATSSFNHVLFRVSKLLKVLLFSIIFKTTKVLCNQKVYTYKIRKMINCEYIFDQKILLVEKIFNIIFARFLHIEHIF